MNLNPKDRQTLELLVGEERERIRVEYENGARGGDLLEDSTVSHFQDIEPTTFEEWEMRLQSLLSSLEGEAADAADLNEAEVERAAEERTAYILHDLDNEMFHGPFKSELDAKRYALLNEWGPADGDGSRFGGLGWNVEPMWRPDGPETIPGLYSLHFDSRG